MLNETDLQEYYEMLDRKLAERKATQTHYHTDRQIALLQELIRVQQQMLRFHL